MRKKIYPPQYCGSEDSTHKKVLELMKWFGARLGRRMSELPQGKVSAGQSQWRQFTPGKESMGLKGKV